MNVAKNLAPAVRYNNKQIIVNRCMKLNDLQYFFFFLLHLGHGTHVSGIIAGYDKKNV
jgi:hypothetical protein